MRGHDSNISVCALAPYLPDTTPSQRFRIEQWLPELAARGISVDILPFVDEELMRLLYQPGRVGAKAVAFARAFLRRSMEIVSAARYDVVLIHRAVCIAGPAALERALALLGRPVIYDFDDAIFVLDISPANRRLGWLKFPGKTATICRLSAHVVAGSPYLADYARQYNQRVTIIPTSVDTELYRPAPRKGNGDGNGKGRVVIGWTGSATSQSHLEMFADVLRELAARRDVEIRVQSNREPKLPGAPYVWRPWSPETEIEELRHFDIGIKPMPDDPWARGKCPMKEIQYMSLGIPAVCSAVGACREIIRHGVNGLLASTPEEWLDCLERLIDDPDLRHRIGVAGRRTVEDHYSKHGSAGLFADVVRQTVEEWRQSRVLKEWRPRELKSGAH